MRKAEQITLSFFAVTAILVFAVIFFVVLYPLAMTKSSNSIRLAVTALLVVGSVAAAVVGIVFYLTIRKKV